MIRHSVLGIILGGISLSLLSAANQNLLRRSDLRAPPVSYRFSFAPVDDEKIATAVHVPHGHIQELTCCAVISCAIGYLVNELKHRLVGP